MFNTSCPGLFGTPAEFRRHYEAPILAGRDAGATDAQVERVRGGGGRGWGWAARLCTCAQV